MCVCEYAWGSRLTVPPIDKGQAFITSLSLSRGLNGVSINSNEHASVFQISHPKRWHVMRLRGNEVSPPRWNQNKSIFTVICSYRSVSQSIRLFFDSVNGAAQLGLGSSSSRARKGPEPNTHTPGEDWRQTWLQCFQSSKLYGRCMAALVWRFLPWAYHPGTSRRRMLWAVQWEIQTQHFNITVQILLIISNILVSISIFKYSYLTWGPLNGIGHSNKVHITASVQ